MENIRAYHVPNAYQALGDPPAVNVVIGKSGTQIESSSQYEQQKLASQRPRGTRLDATGTRIQVKGARNYTSRNLYISREEMYDDVVSRGLRADGLSTKLGVKNHKDGIGKLISELFEGDSRLSDIEEHFKTQRQKSNSAKTMFSTMAHEELQFLKQETFPSRIDVQIRDYLLNAFDDQPEKLQSTVEVLKQIQKIFKAVTPHVDFLSNHNFQTRGFFLDIILMTCSFLMQIIQDSEQGDSTLNQDQQPSEAFDEQQFSNEEKILKENKSAAEILLSVGSDIVEKSKQTTGRKILVPKFSKIAKSPKALPTTIVVEGTSNDYKADDEWTTVEILDDSGNSRYVLIKSGNDDGHSMDTSKILNLLQSQGMTLNDKVEVSFDNNQISSVSGVSDEKPHSGNSNILDQVLRNTSEENLVSKISISQQAEGMASECGDAASFLSDQSNTTQDDHNASVIITQATQTQRENNDDLLIAIRQEHSATSNINKRTMHGVFSDSSKKFKTDCLDPT